LSEKLLHILLCDDDDDDRYLFHKALKNYDPLVDLTFAHDGEALMELLMKNQELPDLIFLDLNMPKKNGFECLEEIKKHTVLKSIPVIIMSTTCQEEAVTKTFDLGASLFIIKPVNFHDLELLIQMGIEEVLQINGEQLSKSKFVLKLSRV
jgi:CheY-like chemotaxis protein